jgi:hypothetical protein
MVGRCTTSSRQCNLMLQSCKAIMTGFKTWRPFHTLHAKNSFREISISPVGLVCFNATSSTTRGIDQLPPEDSVSNVSLCHWLAGLVLPSQLVVLHSLSSSIDACYTRVRLSSTGTQKMYKMGDRQFTIIKHSSSHLSTTCNTTLKSSARLHKSDPRTQCTSRLLPPSSSSPELLAPPHLPLPLRPPRAMSHRQRQSHLPRSNLAA